MYFIAYPRPFNLVELDIPTLKANFHPIYLITHLHNYHPNIFKRNQVDLWKKFLQKDCKFFYPANPCRQINVTSASKIPLITSTETKNALPHCL
jgi:hypothetical protein